jgi:two-component system LytT family sensor kinase
MKTRFLILLLIVFISLPAVAQVTSRWPPFGNNIRFGCTVTEDMRALSMTSLNVTVPDTAVQQLFTPGLLEEKTISALLLGVKLDPSLVDYELASVKSFSKAYTAYRISNNSAATIVSLGITKDNVNDYRYHVVVDDSVEVVHWSKPKLAKLYGAKKAYGFIGKFNYPGKQVLIEVISLKNYQIRDGVIFDWRKNIKPVTIHLIVHGTIRTVTGDITKVAPDSLMEKKAPFNTKNDPKTNEITQISYVQDDVSSIQLILRDHPTIEYDVSIVSTDDNQYGFWGGTDESGFQNSFILRSLPPQPGTYKIVIKPKLSGNEDVTDQTLVIPVIIKPRALLDKKASLKELLPYLIAALLIIGLLFWLYHRRANIRLAKSVQAKQNIGLKLSSIRSQLNPHFMFNALTSIQNLMNKDDTESANHYLSRFADLTRKVLNTSTRELISLDDELKILDDYLQMEQLRFNFKYQLVVDPAINKDNIEVPAMLLQPFVENAVKHGVANIREKGVIMITISQENKNLVLSISDNGAGFQQQNSISDTSFGLKLSRERIKLLNEIYNDQPAVLNIASNKTGTIITITLTNWIS